MPLKVNNCGRRACLLSSVIVQRRQQQSNSSPSASLLTINLKHAGRSWTGTIDHGFVAARTRIGEEATCQQACHQHCQPGRWAPPTNQHIKNSWLILVDPGSFSADHTSMEEDSVSDAVITRTRREVTPERDAVPHTPMVGTPLGSDFAKRGILRSSGTPGSGNGGEMNTISDWLWRGAVADDSQCGSSPRTGSELSRPITPSITSHPRLAIRPAATQPTTARHRINAVNPC